MNTIAKNSQKKHISIKTQTVYALFAIVGAVAIPQLFHVVGAISGLGSSLGESFLPMHLPIILVGLLAGPYAGAVSGLLAPLVSFYISGMPNLVILPFMMIELFSYGLIAGLLRNVKINNFVKVLTVQIGGRAVRAIAIVFSIFVLKNESINMAIIWNSIVTGLFGIMLQWAFIPLLMYRVNNSK